jgi:hypothetical protein
LASFWGEAALHERKQKERKQFLSMKNFWEKEEKGGSFLLGFWAAQERQQQRKRKEVS